MPEALSILGSGGREFPLSGEGEAHRVGAGQKGRRKAQHCKEAMLFNFQPMSIYWMATAYQAVFPVVWIHKVKRRNYFSQCHVPMRHCLPRDRDAGSLAAIPTSLLVEMLDTLWWMTYLYILTRLIPASVVKHRVAGWITRTLSYFCACSKTDQSVNLHLSGLALTGIV